MVFKKRPTGYKTSNGVSTLKEIHPLHFVKKAGAFLVCHTTKDYNDPVSSPVCRIPELEVVLGKLANPFCAHGLLNPSIKNCKLTVDGEDCGTLAVPDLEKLKTMAAPAPFGHNGETVLDDSVRKALEITADRINVKDFENIILPLTYPLYPSNIEIKLYKLNIYEGDGGKFELHQDTPHGENHLASLVVCLPTTYEGGDLIVQHGDKEKRIKCSAAKGGNPTGWWAFFYTDCKHKVDPMISGSRVTLQYDIFTKPMDFGAERIQFIDPEYESDGEDDYESDPEGEEEDDGDQRSRKVQKTSASKKTQYYVVNPKSEPKIFNFEESFRYTEHFQDSLQKMDGKAALDEISNATLLKILKSYKDAKIPLGIVLRHEYATWGPLKPRRLKGFDALLYKAIDNLQPKLKFNSILDYINIDYQPTTGGYDEIFSAGLLVHEQSGPLSNLQFIFTHESALEEYASRSYVEYTGNCSMPAHISYSSSCLVLYWKAEPLKLDAKAKNLSLSVG